MCGVFKIRSIYPNVYYKQRLQVPKCSGISIHLRSIKYTRTEKNNKKSDKVFLATVLLNKNTYMCLSLGLPDTYRQIKFRQTIYRKYLFCIL